MSYRFSDVILVSSLIAAPAWAASVTQINSWLTTISLAVGIILGLVKLYVFVRSDKV